MVKPHLTPKQERFCREYVIDLNGKQAAIRAGYSPSRAKQTASRMVTNGDLSERIAELQAAKNERLGITAERVLAEIARIAFFDIRKLFRIDVTLKEPHELDEDTARAILAIDVTQTSEDGSSPVALHVKRIKAHDKNAALLTLCRHLGIIGERSRFEKQEPSAQLVLVMPGDNREIDPATRFLTE